MSGACSIPFTEALKEGNLNELPGLNAVSASALCFFGQKFPILLSPFLLFYKLRVCSLKAADNAWNDISFIIESGFFRRILMQP